MDVGGSDAEVENLDPRPRLVGSGLEAHGDRLVVFRHEAFDHAVSDDLQCHHVAAGGQCARIQGEFPQRALDPGHGNFHDLCPERAFRAQ